MPRFVDIEPDTYLMDVSQLESAITARTRCIVPVHLFGQCVDMDALNVAASKHGIAARRLRPERRRRAPGTACGIDVPGCSLLVLSDEDPWRIRRRRHGRDVTRRHGGADAEAARVWHGRDDYAEEHGYNSRLDEVHAEILRRKLRRIAYRPPS